MVISLFPGNSNMASSGKKGKKTKGKTLALNDFLQETPGATPTIPIRKTNINWADEVEDNPDQYDSRPKANVVLPTAPKASRGFDEFSEKIPQQPPYIAYLSNLPYDVNEDEIADFFRELKICHMRIPREDRPGDAPRLKGFGYVEFEDRDSLVGALSITDCTLKNRRIRIEVATNLDNDRRRGGRMDNNRDRSERPETSGDWRSGPRVEPTEPERSRGGGFNRDREPGSDRERDRGGSWRDATERPSFRDNDRGGFHRDGERSGFRDGFGERGSRFGDRDRDGDNKRSFGSRRGEREDREITRGSSREEPSERSEPRMRPKLVLAPRTKPKEEQQTESNRDPVPEKETIQISSVPVSANSIFGSAKPVDTSIRERQIEDRLAKAKETESSREGRREVDRKDWGKRDDDDQRWSSRRRESPRRHSPRRSSPEYKNDTSPNRRRSDSFERRDLSGDRKGGSRRSSPDRRGSPERSPSPEYGKYSPIRRRSLERSPTRSRRSPDRRRRSPERSPNRFKISPDRRSSNKSPNPLRRSPTPRRGSPPGRRSPDYKRGSPDRRWGTSPPRQRASSPDKIGSPDRKKRSPDRSQSYRGSLPRKSDEKDRKGPPKNDRTIQKNDRQKREDKIRDNHERELPKLKEPEPPNFAASNKFSYLKAEDDSDNCD